MDDTKRKRGRPPNTEKDSRHIKISISLSPGLNRELEEYCMTYGATKSKVIQNALLNYFMFEHN